MFRENDPYFISIGHAHENTYMIYGLQVEYGFKGSQFLPQTSKSIFMSENEKNNSQQIFTNLFHYSASLGKIIELWTIQNKIKSHVYVQRIKNLATRGRQIKRRA